MKSFLSEVSRLESGNAIDIRKLGSDCCDSFFSWKESDYYDEEKLPDLDSFGDEEFEFRLNCSPIGKLALKYDNSQGKFCNNHLWYLYFDRYAFEDPRDVKNKVTQESDLRTCLAILDLDYVFLHEAIQIACNIPKFDDVPVPKILSIYHQQIVRECYKKGKFETPLWKIENNIISSRNK